jgi:hypothetical protein
MFLWPKSCIFYKNHSEQLIFKRDTHYYLVRVALQEHSFPQSVCAQTMQSFSLGSASPSHTLLKEKEGSLEEKGKKNKYRATATHPGMIKHLGAICIVAAHHCRNVYIRPCGCSTAIHNVFTKNF